ncbi:MAG: hypothetical protein OHK0046_13500 [Anaerolineae bacterium]
MRRLLVIATLLALMLTVSLTAVAQEQRVHVVSAGENLFRISLRYNVSLASLQSANNIANPNLIFVGQRLTIPGAGGTPATPGAPAPTQPPGQSTSYVVVRGDTLGSIARRFNTTVAAIASANGITNPNLIFVGQQLTIPGASGQPPVVITPTPPPGSGQPNNPPVNTGFELGGHAQTFEYVSSMRQAGMTWVKKQLIYNQGDDPSVAQGLIDQANTSGLNIMLGIVGDVNQLRSNTNQYIQDYANFVGGVARLMTNGGAIEVWNEPNIDRQWPNGQISGANYTAMLRAAHGAIKGANNNVLVISGAPAPTGASIPGAVVPDDIFIRDMAAAGAASVMDCVGVHYNEGILPPTATSGDPRGNSQHYSRYYPTMVNLYSSTFPGKPLCFTEIGYLTPEGLGPLPAAFGWAADTSLQEQATWLAQAATLARQSGRVRLFIVWNVDFTRYDDDPQAGFAIVRRGANGATECRACITLGAAVGAS